ncbi:hypothetical protein NH399_15105 [Pleionea sp. CnH1-48]|nr:hypothetical protein [Pleionea sp. CnH1-48]
MTLHQGLEIAPSTSPDGRYILYSHINNTSKNWEVWTFDTIRKKSFRLLSGEASYFQPEWSYDGSQITYIKHYQNSCGYFIADLTPSYEQVIQSSQLMPCNDNKAFEASSLKVSEDIVIFNKASSTRSPLSIYRLNTKSGEIKSLLTPPNDGKGDYFFSLSPDQKKLAVLRSRYFRTTEIWIYDLTSNTFTHLHNNPLTLSRLSWSKDSKKVVFRSNKRTISSLNIESHKVSKVLTLKIKFRDPFLFGENLSSMGICLIMSSFTEKDIYRTSYDGKITESVEASIASEQNPIVSHDEKKIIWVSYKESGRQLWLKESNNKAKRISNFAKDTFIENISLSADSTRLLGINSNKLVIIDLDSSHYLTRYIDKNNTYFHRVIWKNKDNVLATVTANNKKGVVNININTLEFTHLPIDDPEELTYDTRTQTLYYTKEQKPGLWTYSIDKHQNLIELNSKISNLIINRRELYFLSGNELKTLDLSSLKVSTVQKNFMAGNFFLSQSRKWIYYHTEKFGNQYLYKVSNDISPKLN